MIEINLIPDIKQELIRAKRVRNMVVSGAILVGAVSIGIVILLAVYAYAVQPLLGVVADKSIDDNSKKLQAVPDLANMLTIQSQLASISEKHNDKTISSRLFEVLSAVNPAAPNNVVFTRVQLDADENIIRIDAQARSGYSAAEALEKTIRATSFTYQSNSETHKELIADTVVQSNQSFGEDVTGAKVLRFSLDVTYNDALFARSSESLVVSRPDRQDATDSFKRLPESLFGTRAADVGGNK